jgi:hypothetical protein
MRVGWSIVVAGLCVLAACSGSPTKPSDGGSGGSGNGGGGGSTALTCPQFASSGTRAQGTMSGSINGVTWIADCIVVNTATPGIISIAAGDLASGLSYQVVGFAGQKTVGTQTISALSGVNASLLQGSNGWSASLAQGSGTLVFTAATNNSAAGTFSFTMLPTTGGSATGTKTVSGTFNLTF